MFFIICIKNKTNFKQVFYFFTHEHNIIFIYLRGTEILMILFKMEKKFTSMNLQRTS